MWRGSGTTTRKFRAISTGWADSRDIGRNSCTVILRSWENRQTARSRADATEPSGLKSERSACVRTRRADGWASTRSTSLRLYCRGSPTSSPERGSFAGSPSREAPKRAPSARGWVAVNAIHKLAPVLQRLADFQPETVIVDGLAYREGLNAVSVTGGVGGNVIPDSAMLTVNYRFAPSRTVAEASQFVCDLFPECEVTVVDAAPGARPGLDSPLVQEFVAAVGVEGLPKYGWTDVARFSERGIPAVNFGPGDPLKAHADDEHVVASQIFSCEVSLRSWLTGEQTPSA